MEDKLSERQKKALESLIGSEKDFNIQKYEALYPEINRWLLQRHLADLIEKGIVTQEGIKKARYRLNHLLDLLRHFTTSFCDAKERSLS